MKAIGLVFLYDRNLGTPEEISKKFSEHFAFVSENLVMEGLLNLGELKEIIDTKRIYWAGIKEEFHEIVNDDSSIGKLAWKVFKDYYGKEPSEEVKSIIYNGNQVPWDFTLMTCVLYQ